MCAVVVTGNKWARSIRYWQGVYGDGDVMQIKAIVVMIIIAIMLMCITIMNMAIVMMVVVITMVIVYYHG